MKISCEEIYHRFCGVRKMFLRCSVGLLSYLKKHGVTDVMLSDIYDQDDHGLVTEKEMIVLVVGHVVYDKRTKFDVDDPTSWGEDYVICQAYDLVNAAKVGHLRTSFGYDGQKMSGSHYHLEGQYLVSSDVDLTNHRIFFVKGQSVFDQPGKAAAAMNAPTQQVVIPKARQAGSTNRLVNSLQTMYKHGLAEQQTQKIIPDRPHRCPVCNSTAYIGFHDIECSGIGCKHFKLSTPTL